MQMETTYGRQINTGFQSSNKILGQTQALISWWAIGNGPGELLCCHKLLPFVTDIAARLDGVICVVQTRGRAVKLPDRFVLSNV